MPDIPNASKDAPAREVATSQERAQRDVELPISWDGNRVSRYGVTGQHDGVTYRTRVVLYI
jgi:hypothetical protein